MSDTIRPSYAQQVVELRQQLAEAKGAIAAQDEREQRAGAQCGILYEEHGCDWPDAVAERVVHLRERLAEAEAQNTRHLAHIGQLTAQKQKAEAEIARLKAELAEVIEDNIRLKNAEEALTTALSALEEAANEHASIAWHSGDEVVSVSARGLANKFAALLDSLKEGK